MKPLRLTSSSQQQTLDLQGVTFANPPYHSFVVYGREETLQMRVEGLKQVGGRYWQTDRIELYASGTMKNTFFHADDDVLKMYHNNTRHGARKAELRRRALGQLERMVIISACARLFCGDFLIRANRQTELWICQPNLADPESFSGYPIEEKKPRSISEDGFLT